MSNGFNVLVLDDSEVDQMVYQRQLRRSEKIGKIFSYVYAEDALTFLSQENRDRVDLIFLDINMPKIDGFEFLERATSTLGGWFDSAIVVMLTTSASPHDRKRASEFPVVKDFLTKPLTNEYIEHIVGMMT